MKILLLLILFLNVHTNIVIKPGRGNNKLGTTNCLPHMELIFVGVRYVGCQNY